MKRLINKRAKLEQQAAAGNKWAQAILDNTTDPVEEALETFDSFFFPKQNSHANPTSQSS